MIFVNSYLSIGKLQRIWGKKQQYTFELTMAKKLIFVMSSLFFNQLEDLLTSSNVSSCTSAQWQDSLWWLEKCCSQMLDYYAQSHHAMSLKRRRNSCCIGSSLHSPPSSQPSIDFLALDLYITNKHAFTAKQGLIPFISSCEDGS